MQNLNTLSSIWNLIVESNTFNFIIFLAIFGLILKKVNIKDAISSLQTKIHKILDDVKKEKEEAEEKLSNAEVSIANLNTELNVIVDDAKRSAEIIGHKIIDEAKKQVENIEENAIKVIQAEEKQLIAKLSKSTSLVSIEIAEKHIIEELEKTPTLHERYINESIDELDGLKI